MIRLIIFLITGFWWTPQPVCRFKSCRGWRCACSTGYCNIHCQKHCYCGVGEAMKQSDELFRGLPEQDSPPPKRLTGRKK